MDRQIFAPCNICTSTIHGGRMSQGAMDGGAAHPDYQVIQEQLPNDSEDKVEQLPKRRYDDYSNK